MDGKALQIGDRVRLTQNTMMDDAGKLGIVVDKFIPMWCTGAWTVTVQYDANSWMTRYIYPGAPLEKVTED